MSRQRMREYELLSEVAAKQSLGDSVDEMFLISGLGCHPDHQGMGYGSALVDAAQWCA